MHIIVIAWTYVVFMMSIAEQSVVAGIMTFLLYGVVPVTIIVYLSGTKRRRQRRRVADEASKPSDTKSQPET